MEDNEILAARRKRLTPTAPTPAETFSRTVAEIGQAIAIVAAFGIVLWAVLK